MITKDEKRSLALQAYYDGELSGFRRWLMERRLRLSKELRRELAELVELSGWLREIKATQSTHVTPDSWPEIGPALSQIDRELESNRAPGRGGRTWGVGTGDWNWGSLAASGALAVLVLAVLALDGEEVISTDSVPGVTHETAAGSLRYLKTSGVSYVVARDSDDVTIIWLMDPETTREGA